MVDICVLGALSVTIQERNVELRSARSRKLLALLTVHHNNIVPFDRIVGALWEDPPATVRQQVYTVISALRRVLAKAEGAAVIDSVGIGYRLSVDSDAIDLARFQSAVNAAFEAEAAASYALAIDLLQRALREWRGPLTDLSGPYLETIAASLSEERLEAVERLAALLVRHGDSSRIIGTLLELVTEFPFRETLRATLMRVLHVNGRQTDALSSFEEGRLLLADELGLDPGHALRKAHREVLEGYDVEAGETAEPTGHTGWRERRSATQVSAMSYLPRDIPEFCGRDAEIEKLLEGVRAARGHALVVSEIGGMGGVGKTTLAVHVAHRLADAYPDGHYFLDLQGFSARQEPLGPAQALASLLCHSGVAPELIPSDVEDRSAMWRSRTAGSRTLMLLDNAVDEAQVRPLLPGSALSVVLITSRRRMSALQGSISLPLGVMVEVEAVELFRRIVGWERTEADLLSVSEAVRLCGRLPLALQTAAARLRDRPGWTTRQLVDQLADDKVRARFLNTGDRGVTEVLARSYLKLTADQQHLFRLLGTHPGLDFDVSLAAAVMDCPLDEAENRLEELLDANLLEQRTFGRYHLHALVRDCARSLTAQHTTDADRQDRGRLSDRHQRKVAGIRMSTWPTRATA
jgi:DNA-binding SARP family transcriptional activator